MFSQILIVSNRQLGIVPVSALFIIFDFVIHNPFHKETATNISFLDIAAGYFSRWEISNRDSLPASTAAEFSHIARQFVRDVQARLQTTDSRRTSRPEADNSVPMTGEKNYSSGFAVDPNQVTVCFHDALLPRPSLTCLRYRMKTLSFSRTSKVFRALDQTNYFILKTRFKHYLERTCLLRPTYLTCSTRLYGIRDHCNTMFKKSCKLTKSHTQYYTFRPRGRPSNS